MTSRADASAAAIEPGLTSRADAAAASSDAVPDLPMPALPAALTDEQRQAVERRSGALLLAAGAGSGKTSVLVERFVRAVRDDGVTPGRILAITFTERAAGELRERIRARLVELRERDAAREAEEAFVTTFHGFCARVLRAHPLQAGVDPRYSVLDEGLASRLAMLAFGDALGSFQAERSSAAVDLVAAYGADALQRIVLGAYSQLRSQGQTNPRLPVEPPGDDARPEAQDAGAWCACELIDDLLQRFSWAYRARKRGRGALDFDDLELLARDLLREHDDIRGAWSQRFEMLMVDEFQDTNPRQLELLELLQRDNLFTVGDELQSIYGFRHADVRVFRERRERLAQADAALALTHNFRSRPEILAAVERVFAERLGARYTPLVVARGARNVREGGGGGGGDGEGPCVELLLTDCAGWEKANSDATGTPWRVAEARMLASRIGELVAGGQARAGDVVVLLRALGDVPLYESALRVAGLPTLATVGDFWGQQQVRELIAYLQALCNPLDELALYGTLASPLVGLLSDGMALVARAARERRGGAWSAIAEVCDERAEALPSGCDGERPEAPLPGCDDERAEALPSGCDGERLRRFRAWFMRERATAALHPLADLLRRAMRASGYEAYVLSLPWGRRRMANVHKLLAVARGFEAQEGRDLRAFLDHAAHLMQASAGREAQAPVLDGHIEAVRLMSVHAAKGLEFPVVCVADLGRTPSLPVADLLVERDGRVGLRLARLGDFELTPALDFAELREKSRVAQQEEEDRILYVAMTRACERLVLSGALDFARWPALRTGAPPIAWVAPALVPDAASLVEAGHETLDVEVQDGSTVRCTFNRASSEQRRASALPSRSEHEPTVASARMPRATVASGPTDPPAPVGAQALAGSVAPVGAAAPAQARALIDVPALSDPDATVSYSSLMELERCGYRYYLERVLHLRERRVRPGEGHDGGLRARMRGTIVHLVLETVDFARSRPLTGEDVAAAARRVGARVTPAEREQIAALMRRALQTELATRIARGRKPRREHPFAFSLGAEQPLVSGVLDLLVEEPDGSALIVDYKSDSLAQEQDLEQLASTEYGLQRMLYALASIEAGAQQVHVAHWFLERPEEPVIESFSANARVVLRGQLLERFDRLRGRGFSVTESPHRGICLTCPGRGTLCSWGETHTLRERLPTLGSSAQMARLTS